MHKKELYQNTSAARNRNWTRKPRYIVSDFRFQCAGLVNGNDNDNYNVDRNSNDIGNGNRDIQYTLSNIDFVKILCFP